MRRIIWTEPAEADLERIRIYIGQFNPLAAQRMSARLQRAGDALQDFPERGKLVKHGRRVLTFVTPYLIYYRTTPDTVYILRVRHGARRP